MMNPRLMIFLAFAGLLFSGLTCATPPAPAAGVDSVSTTGPHLLREYLRVIEGTWVNEGYATGVDNGEILQEQQADLSILIDPQKILGNQALIVVSEYCSDDLVQYLHFELAGDHLELVGGSAEGCFIDMPRIEYMTLRFVVENQDTILLYEARETEYENEQSERLVRNHHHLATDGDWSCGLQAYLNALLRTGTYEVYTSTGKLIAPEDAFGEDALAEDLAYFDAFSYFWPGYEELCVRTEFEVVLLGGYYPGADLKIYAIEWDVNEIRLFQTDTASHSDDNAYPLVKGTLIYRIVPFEVQPAPDI